MGWYVLIGVIVLFGAILARLRRRLVGLGLALLGAILAGGLAFAAGASYLKYCYVPPRPRHDMDFTGIGTIALCAAIIPAGSAVAGLFLGLLLAFWLDRYPADR